MSESVFDDIGVEQQLQLYGVYASNTRGVSMEPLFRTHRDMVILTSPKGECKKYDVILYKTASGKYILHRVVGIREEVYLVRGDNTYTLERVPKGAVIGVLTEFNRKGKHHSIDETGYKVYSRVWNFLYPVRYLYALAKRYFLAVIRKLKRLFKSKNK